MKTERTLSLAIVGTAILVALLVYSTRNTATSPTASALRQELLAIENSIPTEAGKKNFLTQSNNLAQRVGAELVDLDSQIISCDANVDGIASLGPPFGGASPLAGRAGAGEMSGSCIDSNSVSAESVKGKFMSGQCCSAMTDTMKYHENLEKLRAYKSMPNIPLDPMHTPVQMAKMWIDYDKATTLTPAEQKIYDEAYAISKEKPCCCKCWHYFVNEGIAKKMIKDVVFNAEQIAAYWDASDICGA